MSGLSKLQLRLRNAFRHGYFLFLSTLMPLCVLLCLAVLAERYAIYFNPSPVYAAIALLALLGVGLIMPIFLALWLIIAKTMLRNDTHSGAR